MTDATFYSYINKKWIEKITLKEPLTSDLYETIEELDRALGKKHWAFPSGFNPKDFPELLKMEQILHKHTKSYLNDFYLHDIHSHLMGDRHGVWMLRESGTHYVRLGDDFNPDFIKVYESFLYSNDYYYLIEGDRITKKNAKQIFEIFKGVKESMYKSDNVNKGR